MPFWALSKVRKVMSTKSLHPLVALLSGAVEECVEGCSEVFAYRFLQTETHSHG